MSNIKYVTFVTSELYPLFSFVLENYKKELNEKMLREEDKEKVWEYHQSIRTLNKFLDHIDIESKNTTEE